MFKPIITDFLILGSGVAGLAAAIEAAPHGEVLLATKAQPHAGNTPDAQGGIAAAWDEEDSPLAHAHDTEEAGAGLCNSEAVRVLVEEAADAIKRLIEWGMPFDRRGDELRLGREGAHGRHRILHARGDATGQALSDTLRSRLAATSDVTELPDLMALDLLIDDGQVTGAWCMDRAGRLVEVRAGAVLLASGGLGQLYLRTTNAVTVTGDGMAIAWRAGALLGDLEFFQFHPTAFAVGDASHRPLFLASEALRGEGAVLLDSLGRAFMWRHHPLKDLAPRDVVTRAIFQEMKATGSDHVYLDLTPLADFAGRFPTIHEACRRMGLAMNPPRIPVAPAAHYAMGGVVTDTWGRTNLPGLYAAGEVSNTGVHGANRLASNSLLEGIVFGRRMAMAAASDLRGELRNPGQPKPTARIPVLADEPLSAAGYRELVESLAALARPMESMRHHLQEIMWHQVGVLRNGADLRQAERAILELEGHLTGLLRPADRTDEKPSSPAHLVRAWAELRNLLLMGLLTTRAAARRTESRGSHFRTDYPKRDDEIWLRHLTFQKDRPA